VTIRRLGGTDNKFIKIGKFLWVPIYLDYLHQKLHSMEGPCCPKCHTKLSYNSNGGPYGSGVCPECGFEDKYPENLLDMESNVKARYQSALRSNWQVESLEIAPTATKKSDHTDEKYWIEVKVGQKNGKKTAMILIGEKMGTQAKTDYAQIFLDLENEMVSFDKTNKNPTGLLASFKAVFPGSETEVKKRK